jgi:hypothetical protein
MTALLISRESRKRAGGQAGGRGKHKEQLGTTHGSRDCDGGAGAQVHMAMYVVVRASPPWATENAHPRVPAIFCMMMP